MKIKYDSSEDAIYIKMASGKYSKSRKISDTVLVDEDVKGKILGIEILDAKKNIKAFDPQKTKFEASVV